MECEEFVKPGPKTYCTKCGSTDINEYKFTRAGPVIYIRIHCTSCGRDFKERYVFTGIQEVDDE